MASFPLPPGQPALYPNSDAGFTAPSLSDWQFEYNGLMFGPSTDLGILKIEGLGALPNVGSEDVPFPRDTGEWQGVDAMAGRDPIIDLWTSTDVYAQFRNVGAAVAVNPYSVLPLWWQLPSYEILCSMCRPRKRTSIWDADTAAAGQWAPTLTWHANDPRLYGQGQVSNCPSGGDSVSWAVDNAGNCEMRPVIVLTGPLAGPSIFNETISGSPGIVFQEEIAVASGDQVVVDLDPLHLVTYYVGGIASPSARVPIYNWLDFPNTTWWNLLVGTNDLTATVHSGTISADQFAVWWANAYMLWLGDTVAEIRYNNSLGQLGAPMGSTDTSITFTGSPGWATLTGGDFIKLELDPPTSTNPVPNPLFEVVYVTAYTGSSSTATISRGEEGTTPVDHAVNATWINGPTAADDVAAVTSVFGRSGDVLAESGDYDVAEVTGAAPLAGPTFTGDVTLASGSLDVASAGEGLAVAEGSNAKQGTVTLVAGTAVVANTSVTATSRIFLTCQSLGTVTVPSGYGVSARTPGTSFTILASAPTDTSVIAYELFEVG